MQSGQPGHAAAHNTNQGQGQTMSFSVGAGRQGGNAPAAQGNGMSIGKKAGFSSQGHQNGHDENAM